MCGITGFWQVPGQGKIDLLALTRRMAAQMEHRGPDDADEWVDAQCGLGFGFRRLAIVDLSPTGRQPMVSASGRYVIIFNGEVYNFAAVRAELEKMHRQFRGGSDTEVLLAAIEQWGLPSAIKRFVGMFGFALWDQDERALHLVRDRLGAQSTGGAPRLPRRDRPRCAGALHAARVCAGSLRDLPGHLQAAAGYD